MRKFHLYYLLMLTMVLLTGSVSIFKENISAISHYPLGYLLILINNLLMALLSISTMKKLCSRSVCLVAFLGYIIPVVLPYFSAGEFISELHITLAFSGLILLVGSIIKMLYELSKLNYLLARKLYNLCFISAFVIVLIYSKFLLINGLMEIIFTVTILSIFIQVEKAFNN